MRTSDPHEDPRCLRGRPAARKYRLVSQHHWGHASAWNQERSKSRLRVLTTLGPKEVLLNEFVSMLKSVLGLPGRSKMPRTRGPDSWGCSSGARPPRHTLVLAPAGGAGFLYPLVQGRLRRSLRPPEDPVDWPGGRAGVLAHSWPVQGEHGSPDPCPMGPQGCAQPPAARCWPVCPALKQQHCLVPGQPAPMHAAVWSWRARVRMKGDRPRLCSVARRGHGAFFVLDNTLKPSTPNPS